MTKQYKFIISLLLTIAIVYFIHPEVIYGEDQSIDSMFSADDYWKNIVYVFGVLIVIIGLIIGLIRVLSAKNRGLMSSRSFKTLSGISLGQHKSIQLVEIGTSLYIVGVGDTIELLDKIEDEAEIVYIKQSLSTAEGQMRFNLQSVVDRFRKSDKQAVAEIEDELSFQEVFYDKMNRIKQQKNEVEHILKNEDRTDRNNSL